MTEIVSAIIENIKCECEIVDVVDGFNGSDIDWINDYPLYFQNDLKRLFWFYCLYNFSSMKEFRDLPDEMSVINETLRENGRPEITRDEVVSICQPGVKIILNEFDKFIVLVINGLYPKICKLNDKPEHIRTIQLKELIGKMCHHHDLCETNHEPTNFDKLCEYIKKYMNTIELDHFWTNQIVTLNGHKMKLDLYYETDETHNGVLTKMMDKDFDIYSTHEILQKTMNAILHAYTRTDFMSTRMSADIKLYTLFPWDNKVMKFKYDPAINEVSL